MGEQDHGPREWTLQPREAPCGHEIILDWQTGTEAAIGPRLTEGT